MCSRTFLGGDCDWLEMDGTGVSPWLISSLTDAVLDEVEA